MSEKKEPTQIWLPDPSSVKVWVKGNDVRMDANTLEFGLKPITEKKIGFGDG